MTVVFPFRLLLLLIIELVASHRNAHQCVHNDIEHTIHQQFVKYKKESVRRQTSNRRNLLQSSSYEPIRIRPYYDPKSINESILTIEQISHIKSLVSASIHYLQSFINVIPVDGALFVDRCPYNAQFRDEFLFSRCQYHQYTEPKTCGMAVIPDEHLAESWYYNTTNGWKSELYAPGGIGIANVDLIIYVTYSEENCGSKTLAYAIPCSVDQRGRPIAGTINYCPKVIEDEPYWKYDVLVTLHELTHVLVFSPFLWRKFYDWNVGAIIPYDQVVLQTNITSDVRRWIISPKVKELAQEHYNCDTLPGAPLENWGPPSSAFVHWEAKYMQYEYMNAYIPSANLYVSKFTLALMEDSGWYGIDWNYAEPYTWGLNEGCQFFNESCIDNATGISNYPQYFCESNMDNGCSFDYTSIGLCLVLNYTKTNVTIPDRFKYYTNDYLGGPELHDFCGIRNPLDIEVPFGDKMTNYSDFEPICWDERGNTFETAPYLSSYYGRDSRCVDTKNINGTKSGYCFKHECIEYDLTQKMYNAVRIEINSSDIITCYRNESLMDMDTHSYTSLISIKCPNIDTICGDTSSPFQCYWGHYNDNLKKCVCSVGYIGDECNIKDINYIVPEAIIERTPSPTNSIPQVICLLNMPSNLFPFEGEYVFDGQYEGYPIYAHHFSFDDNFRITFYLRYFQVASQWQFIDENNNLYGYCGQYGVERVADIENCENWYLLNQLTYFSYYSHLCPTKTPTINPTMEPTINPTIEPTIYPINNATKITIEAITNPTKSPSINAKIEFPPKCVDECDAFSVLLNNMEHEDDNDDDIICLQYTVNRLYSDGYCYKSIKHITLGLCEEDVIGGKCNNNILHGFIESIYSFNFPYIRAFGASQGIQIKFGERVNTEISFELCLKNVFKNDIYSDIVLFKKGRKKYLCKESYLFGLPCLNNTKFIDDNDKERRRRTKGSGYKYDGYRYHAINGNEEEIDEIKKGQTSSPTFWTSMKAIFIILAIIFIIIITYVSIWYIINLIKKKKKTKYNKVDNNKEIEKTMERTNNIDDELEMGTFSQ